ncbi:histidine phosphotransferase family protein [Shimia thalassica]|uniref:histidine phosphotransferase family protein n=1 Tax=Shimia thalassica TaxID=1715693 RepID=UPI0026E38538|nr:histidine phosphotransferase family protein [Shimia thalassica]MDO6485164.1 histidine phosphotransferase family protein [Shimia thalassica]
MNNSNTDFAALVGSRICHDLISPVGAIGNGLELIEMSGAASGPELELISDSVGSANARIRFFRIAFGHSGAGQGVSLNEIKSLLADVEAGGRISYDWQGTTSVDRPQLRAVFLAIMCLETALPYGGVITIAHRNDLWDLSIVGRKLNIDRDLWGDLHRSEKRVEITAGFVQFGLFPPTLAELGKTLFMKEADDGFSISF